MADALALWSHALAALLFAALALWAVKRPSPTLSRWPLVAALAATAVWALAVAGLGGADAATRAIDGVRNLATLGLMFALHRRCVSSTLVGVMPIYGVLAMVVVAGTVLQLAAGALGGSSNAVAIANAAVLLRMMAAVSALTLVQNLWSGHDRGDVRMLALALGFIWFADLNLTTAAFLVGSWPVPLVTVRGLMMALSAGIVAAAIQRGDRGPVAVSRTVAYQSLSLVAVAAYFAILALVTSGLSVIGGTHARILQTAFVFGSSAAALTLVASPWLRAWVKVKVAKHLFRHRYDYRAEWLRFTGTLGQPEDAAPLAARVVKAVADLTDSPAGLLLVPDGEALAKGAEWNWGTRAGDGIGDDFARHLLATERVIEIDPLRAGRGDPAEVAMLPRWMADDDDGWVLVPLIHLGKLAGAIVLARPPVDRALDWEDFDLLKVAGRQVASYLAEARAQDALAEGARFEEFNRRFAFIVHDIKNLVSGLSLVARNAERHAENPDFRADMVATLQDSAAKLNALLARLSANHNGRADPPVSVPLRALAERIAAARRASHPVIVVGEGRALADPARLEQLLAHLVQNAIEASAPAEPVTIAIAAHGDTATIAIVDCGCGMTGAFVRDQLFRPFASSKPGGFGIGAFEARQLAEAMGGRIEVESREGAGSTFRVILPLARELSVAA